MNIESTPYRKWVENLKYGDLVLLVDGEWSMPVIFSNWNGESSSYGYRADYYPIWTHETVEALNISELNEKSFQTSYVNKRAEKRFYPFSKKLLSKKQLKFYELFKHFKL